MIKQFIKGKVYVFIDAANIFYSQKTLGWRVSYEKLINYFRDECDLGHCFLYTGKISGDIKQQRFLDMLEITGYIVRTKEVKKIHAGKAAEKRKCNLDIELTLDIISTMSKFDTAVLISGDSDYAPVVDKIKREGKRVIIISTRGHISKELLDRAKYIDLRKLKNYISL